MILTTLNATVELASQFILLTYTSTGKTTKIPVAELTNIAISPSDGTGSNELVFTTATDSYSVSYTADQQQAMEWLCSAWTKGDKILQHGALARLSELVKQQEADKQKQCWWLGSGKGIWMIGFASTFTAYVIAHAMDATLQSPASSPLPCIGMSVFWMYVAAFIIKRAFSGSISNPLGIKPLIGYSAAIGVLITVLGTVLPDVNSSNVTSPTEFYQQTEKEPITTYQRHESFKVGTMKYKVQGIEWREGLGNEYVGKTADSRYLLVSLLIKNEDKDNRSIPPFTLVDTAGNSYDQAAGDSMYLGDYAVIFDNLNPGVQKKGILVFDVPPDNHYNLVVSGGYWSGEEAQVKLN